VHQINQVLSRSNTGGATPEQVKAMSREVLEKLIDQQLAIDQATEKKLHRSPEVVAEIEASRRDILARAYLQSVAAELPKPTADETHKYFADHPQLFSERRIFNVQELQAPASPATAEQLRSMAAAGKSAEEAAAWLKSKGIRFGGGNATRPAEQIPLEALPKVAALKDGQSVVLETPQGLTFMRVVASQAAPVAEDAAGPRIQQFLANQRAGEAVKANMKQLRDSAKITYMGEFDSTRPAPDAGAGLIK
jgi:EpsD family peptidyl-prolyl cis-trans isomerase